MQPSGTAAQHPPCPTPCWEQIAPHSGPLCKRQIGDLRNNLFGAPTPRNLPPQARPERGLAAQRALFRRLASVVITAIPPSPRPRRNRRQAGRAALSVRPGVCPTGVGIISRCARTGRARTATFLPIPPGICRRSLSALPAQSPRRGRRSACIAVGVPVEADECRDVLVRLRPVPAPKRQHRPEARIADLRIERKRCERTTLVFSLTPGRSSRAEVRGFGIEDGRPRFSPACS